MLLHGPDILCKAGGRAQTAQGNGVPERGRWRGSEPPAGHSAPAGARWNSSKGGSPPATAGLRGDPAAAYARSKGRAPMGIAGIDIPAGANRPAATPPGIEPAPV